MERIVISEVDNTSNIEALSSYDVVYVPGFSNNKTSPLFQGDNTLFRTPTLVTSRYEFVKLFGENGKDVCPTFPSDQPYPVATAPDGAEPGKYGFPSYAIPNFVAPTDPVQVPGVTQIDYSSATGATVREKIKNAVTATENYIYADTTIHTDDTNSWSPTQGIIYYLAAQDGGQAQSVTMRALNSEFVYTAVTASGWLENANPSLKGWYERTGTEGSYVYTLSVDTEVGSGKTYYFRDYSNLYVFKSLVSPVSQGWYTNGGTTEKPNYVLTDDTYIGFNIDPLTSSNTTVKSYFEIEGAQLSLMFRGPSGTELGDADPGYRYALYLLSLGIPVYYEQMNSSFAPVDFTDGTYVIDKNHKVVDVNPKANGWFVLINDVYIRTDDTVAYYYGTSADKTYYQGADISIKSMYEGLEARFARINDTQSTTYTDYSFDNIGDYSIKYFTTGGYPVYEYGPLVSDNVYLKRDVGTSPLALDMIATAEHRGDAVALIDHTNNPNRTIYESDKLSVINRIRNDDIGNLTASSGAFGAMFTPWYNCSNTIVTGGSTKNYANQMPASLAFLSALAKQVTNFNPWLAVAGVTRGAVPYCASLHTNYTLSNNVADSYQVVPGDDASVTSGSLISINPITKIRNVGFCIWGNRTLRNNDDGTQATSFLNIRDLVSDIKKELYAASQQLMFEQNSDMLWLTFKSKISPLLDSMKSANILQDYSIKKYNVDPITGLDVPAYKLLAIIQIRPINSIEIFQLQVQIENADFNVAEVE